MYAILHAEDTSHVGDSILEILSFAAIANTYVACNKTHSERIVTTILFDHQLLGLQ